MLCPTLSLFTGRVGYKRKNKIERLGGPQATGTQNSASLDQGNGSGKDFRSHNFHSRSETTALSAPASVAWLGKPNVFSNTNHFLNPNTILILGFGNICIYQYFLGLVYVNPKITKFFLCVCTPLITIMHNWALGLRNWAIFSIDTKVTPVICSFDNPVTQMTEQCWQCFLLALTDLLTLFCTFAEGWQFVARIGKGFIQHQCKRRDAIILWLWKARHIL